jgi:hypothetical protein
MLEFVKYLTPKERKLMHFLVINAQICLDKKRTPTQLDRDTIQLAGDIVYSINKIEIQNTGSFKINPKESK